MPPSPAYSLLPNIRSVFSFCVMFSVLLKAADRSFDVELLSPPPRPPLTSIIRFLLLSRPTLDAEDPSSLLRLLLARLLFFTPTAAPSFYDGCAWFTRFGWFV